MEFGKFREEVERVTDGTKNLLKDLIGSERFLHTMGGIGSSIGGTFIGTCASTFVSALGVKLSEGFIQENNISNENIAFSVVAVILIGATGGSFGAFHRYQRMTLTSELVAESPKEQPVSLDLQNTL